MATELHKDNSGLIRTHTDYEPLIMVYAFPSIIVPLFLLLLHSFQTSFHSFSHLTEPLLLLSLGERRADLLVFLNWGQWFG
jgi:hypothetical protein